MSDIPEDLLYTEEHEYLKSTPEAGVYLVGITDYAQGELGDVVFVELPEVGESLQRMDAFGTIEAVKAVSDLFMPLTGEITAVNEELEGDPSLVNSDPYGDGWMVRIEVEDEADLDELMGPSEYADHIGE